MTEDEKRIFDSLSNLEEQQWREIENKIKLEWRLSFAIWGSLLAASAAIIGGKLHFRNLPIEQIMLSVLVIIFLVVILHVLFLYWIQRSLQRRRKSLWVLRKAMEELIPISIQKGEYNRKIPKQVSIYVQVLISVLLSIIFLYVMSLTPKDNELSNRVTESPVTWRVFSPGDTDRWALVQDSRLSESWRLA